MGAFAGSTKALTASLHQCVVPCRSLQEAIYSGQSIRNEQSHALGFSNFFLTCATYTHFRGRARHGSFFRQIFDHSTFTAPINCFAYLFSKVPNTPYVSPAAFTELAILRANWRVFREEALALEDAKRIQAAEKYNDIGFNSFFRTGWKRFYLKWYDEPHPSASALCPRSVEILQNIPSVKAAMFAMLPAGEA